MGNVQRYNLFVAPFVAGYGLYSGLWIITLVGCANWAIGCWWGKP